MEEWVSSTPGLPCSDIGLSVDDLESGHGIGVLPEHEQDKTVDLLFMVNRMIGGCEA